MDRYTYTISTMDDRGLLIVDDCRYILKWFEGSTVSQLNIINYDNAYETIKKDTLFMYSNNPFARVIAMIFQLSLSQEHLSSHMRNHFLWQKMNSIVSTMIMNDQWLVLVKNNVQRSFSVNFRCGIISNKKIKLHF